MPPLEPMSQFFDTKATGYDQHMLSGTVNAAYYKAIAEALPASDKSATILDLGAGTGLELEYVFARLPHAHITCIDLSSKMLDLLTQKYASHASQITPLVASYLDHPWGDTKFDFIISSMTLHHFTSDIKLYFYRRLRTSLNPGGFYVEGDYVVTPKVEAQKLEDYFAQVLANPDCADGATHIDIPFSLATQKQLLSEAGFTQFCLAYQSEESAVYSAK